MSEQKYILKFSELSMKDVPMVGGKNASLGEMYNKLVKKGINIPHGFAVTAEGFKAFLQFNEIDKEIKKILNSIDYNELKDLKDKGQQIRQLILKSDFPEDLEKAIIKAYQNLSQEYDKDNLDVAIRSSATAEDLPVASFAGQLESFLNVKGQNQLLANIKKCFASLYGNRTISYVHDQDFKYDNIFLSVGVQKMVRSDKASAGVIFTIDTETGFKDVVLINSAYGLGENVVKGRINPDQFYIFKPTLAKDFQAIISKELGSKEKKLIYKTNGKKTTANVSVDPQKQANFSLTDKEILQLAKWSVKIEKLYDKPMDIEWAKDGLDNKLYIVQARPETISHKKDTNILEEHILQEKGKVLCQGNSIGEKIGQGQVKVIKDVKNITKFKKGDVLVTTMTDPDWEPVMKKAAAIVTDLGGRTSHAAIVSRELGVPAIVGTKDATQVLKDKNKVTVSCAEGEKGYVYQGILDFQVKKTNLKKIPQTKTKIMMILAEPNLAFKYSFLPSQGVGLARIEFIIANNIKIHPLALLNFKDLEDKKLKDKINKLTQAFDNKKQYYIDKLAWGMAKIAAAFYPQEVIVRFSDFKTNEYANLIGGESFEPEEANPMLGWRGASRYYDDKFQPAFELECQAVKKVRQEMGLKNLKIMVPFCRTIEEGKKVLKILKNNGLKSGQDDLQIYVMIEIPSNVLLADEFAQIFDGFSIGSNDLTQLTLGLDRDSELISDIADERNEAVKKLISQVIKTAKKHKIKIGICGQAPSDFPDFAKFLSKQGIDSISLNPDTVIKTRLDLGKSK
ncbi:MAG: phosphoenolpyruvate synthase [Candidatus Buchananbacteria bacterium]|nr:phosphoenolpyruvate synthase [Candidatus Buchananbacteria bacterium]